MPADALYCNYFLIARMQAPGVDVLAKLYEHRWNIELDFRNLKTTLGVEVLSCKTPQMSEKELWVYLPNVQTK